jgi:UDP-N-acetylmuramoyl-L-alanyl-D-glutamate--2,6-diaminopimelate ligase
MKGTNSGRARVKPHSQSVKTFSQLMQAVPGARVMGNGEVPVTGLAYDSRRVEPGYAFICVRGGTADGHDFIPQALEKGAAALVVEPGRGPSSPPPGIAVGIIADTRAAMPALARWFCDDPCRRLTLVGVTGTNGKTTTSLMIDAIFRAAGKLTGVIGTVEYRIGDTRRQAPHTTPEAVDLQGLFADMVGAGVTHAAMEVSSHALSLHRVDGCRFAGAVFTNLTPEHLDFHPDMAHYLEAKAQLFVDQQYLPEDGARANAINADDPAGPGLAGRALGRTLTYGVDSPADCRAEGIELGTQETRFTAALPTGAMPIRMRPLALFNVSNALAAMAVCTGLGLPPEAIQAGIESLPPVRGRFDRVPSPYREVIVDYAHTPDGLETALEAARQLARGRVIVVFGCGGNRDRTKRPVMGGIASRLADHCVVTSDNPRKEEPEAIIAEIVQGIPAGARGKCVVEADRATAIRLALAEAGPQDLVLIAGKGHEDYQILGDRTIHFDDREVAQQVLEELEARHG